MVGGAAGHPVPGGEESVEGGAGDREDRRSRHAPGAQGGHCRQLKGNTRGITYYTKKEKKGV